MTSTCLPAVSLIVLSWIGACIGQADEFVVHSEIFVEGETIPVARNVTYFLADQIVDTSLDSQGEVQSVTTLTLKDDGLSNNIQLLNRDRKIVCRLTTDELLQAVAAVTSRLEDKPEIVRFAADAKFEVEWESEKLLLMSAKPMSYELSTTSEPQPAAALRYRQFADLSARLNVTRPGGLPPAARLAVNQEVASRTMVPTRVQLSRANYPKYSFSVHRYETKISASQRQLLTKIEKWATESEATDLVSFRLGPHASRDSDAAIARENNANRAAR